MGKATRTCTYGDCDRKHVALGLCGLHRSRKKKGVPMDAPLRKILEGDACTHSDCRRRRWADGLCALHYKRRRAGAPMDAPPRRLNEKTRRLCQVIACQQNPVFDGLCEGHQDWSGLRYSRRVEGRGGYVVISVGPGYQSASATTGYMLEHRYVMELNLGRYLHPGENVHHINGVRHDNSQGNLELWLTHQPQGQRVVDLFAWAQKIMSTYVDEIDSLR